MFKKIVRWSLFGIACLVTLVALFIAEENWRSKRAWQQYKQTLEARGERLDRASMIPPAVPDDQNFAMTPMLKPLFPHGTNYVQELGDRLELPGAAERENKPGYGDWDAGRPIDLDEWQEYFGGSNVLQVLQKFDPELGEITAASRRPYARFPVRYEDGLMMLIPHHSPLRQLARLYTLRACAELTQGQTDRAAEDVATILRLADSLKEQPLLLPELVRIVILQMGMQPIWEGLQRHQWSDNQLAALQNELQRMDLLAGGLRALQGERAMFNDTLELAIARPTVIREHDPKNKDSSIWMARLPRCVLYQNMIAVNRFYEEQMLPIFNVAEHRVDPRRADSNDQQLRSMRQTPYSIFAKLFMPALSGACMQSARAQTVLDEATVACALERYRLARGEYPESLDALTPQFIAKLPHDVINGQPLHYRRTADGWFVLYSVGWNETDDGGRIAFTDSQPPRQDWRSGDWVWRYTAAE